MVAKVRASISTPLRYPPTVHLSDECKDFIEKLLCFDVRHRMNATEALRHCWIGDDCLITEQPELSVRSLPSIAEEDSPGPGIVLLSPDDTSMCIRDDSPSAPSPSPITHSPSAYSPADAGGALHLPAMHLSGSMDFSCLEELDGQLIDALLDEVDEDEKEAAITPKRSRSGVWTGSCSPSKGSTVHSRRSSSRSVLDFEAEQIDGDVIDSILDEVQLKERQFGRIDDMELSTESKVMALKEVASATDDAVEALTGWFAGIGHQMKDIVVAIDGAVDDTIEAEVVPPKESKLMKWAKLNMVDVGKAKEGNSNTKTVE